MDVSKNPGLRLLVISQHVEDQNPFGTDQKKRLARNTRKTQRPARNWRCTGNCKLETAQGSDCGEVLQRHAWPKLSPGDHRASEAETNPFDLLKTYVVALVCDSDIGTSLGWFLLAGPALSMFFQTKWRPSLRPLYLNLESQCHAWLSCGFTHRSSLLPGSSERTTMRGKDAPIVRELFYRQRREFGQKVLRGKLLWS